MTHNHSHHHGHRQRLRQRFIQHGLDGFADYEVVELLLTLAIPRADVKKPAKALIARFGNLRGILDAPHEQLQDVPGIGTVTVTLADFVIPNTELILPKRSAPRSRNGPTISTTGR